MNRAEHPNTSALFVLKHGSLLINHRRPPLTTLPPQTVETKLQRRCLARPEATMVNTARNTGRLPILMLLMVAPCVSFLCSGPSTTSLPLRCSSASSSPSSRLRPRPSPVPHCTTGGMAGTGGSFSMNGSDRYVSTHLVQFGVLASAGYFFLYKSSAWAPAIRVGQGSTSTS